MQYILKNVQVVNRGTVVPSDVLINNGRFGKIDGSVSSLKTKVTEIDGKGMFLLPGIIDIHVHFREPGLTYKGDISSESKAAIAGGITSFIEMPNTKPPAVTNDILQEKFELAKEKAWANYSFYLGATNDNIEELKLADKTKIGGIKIFMGSSTGNMLVDDPETLERIFGECDNLIAVHAEDEGTITANLQKAKVKYGADIPPKAHAEIRSAEGCYKSSSFAVELAKRKGARLHVLHLTTAKEVGLFQPAPVIKKKITTEACVHHLLFDDSDYARLGNKIKCNPAIKSNYHRKALWEGLLNKNIDLISSDHAPHTLEEKRRPYLTAPSGIPLVQHTLPLMLNEVNKENISIETVVTKMCHNPAMSYKINSRGFIEEGFHADCVLVDLNESWTVTKDNIYFKCGWSPFEGEKLKGKVMKTFVNGELAFDQEFQAKPAVEALTFDR